MAMDIPTPTDTPVITRTLILTPMAMVIRITADSMAAGAGAVMAADSMVAATATVLVDLVAAVTVAADSVARLVAAVVDSTVVVEAAVAADTAN
jgi:hypothetical protein